ncbi:hypothetical protein [Undibacterium oligocarboniphilum]|uniref:Uncharacterized protein n=1 Tax=Undibacterium oligocarboniphilum TaxID=666702 RepID=A0A850QPH5_9BURK|nr:hypothetical protein [Undibacterium oligocarboniphilum]MBC3870303.1 hypothetical protein [Undibacterium oligocarboniphilum]NVO78294.1 hypothetical protein [Undibacterium oligocarboniphilum]
MKKIKQISLLLVMLTYLSLTQAKDNQQICIYKSAVISIAIAERNSGMSPQEALPPLKRFAKDGLSLDWIKKAINLVYFNSAFTNANGEVAGNQVYNQCMRPDFEYKPLK